MSRVGIVFACLFLFGCTLQPIAPERAAQYKRVGVLSAMGDRFAAGAVGITAFGNAYREEQLDLGADELFTEKVKQALSARYAVVDLTQYRSAFLKEPKYWPGQNKIIGESRPSVSEVVQRLMGAEALDAYVIVTPAFASVRGTNQGVGGIGVVKLQRLLGSDDFRLHAAYIVAVIDGRDYSVVADMRASSLGESGVPLVGGSQLNTPNAPVAAPVWDAPAANKDTIRTAFDLLITRSIPETLRRANLIE